MPDSAPLPPDIEAQIAALPPEPHRPLVICDADEVLFQFLAGLEEWLDANGWRWEARRPASLYGTILPKDGGAPMGDESVGAMLENFYATHVETLRPIPDAAESLNALARHARVLIVTNLPPAYKEGRLRALRAHGMAHPLIVNRGLKGAALARLLHRHRAPAFFVEDMSVHLESVEGIAGLECIQLITHRRLAEATEPAANAWQAREWRAVRRRIESRLTALGYISSGRTSVTSGI